MDMLSGFLEEYRPPSKFYFRVDFPAFPAPNGYGFQEVSGMKVSWKTEEISEGGLNTHSHKVPSKLSYDSNLMMKRGIVNLASPLVVWFKTFLEWGTDAIITKKIGPVQTNNLTQPCSVSLLDENGIPTMVWAFVDTYPVSWSFSDLDSMSDGEVMIEEMELSYSYFMRML